MRREFRSELKQLKHKETAFINDIYFLKQELNLMRIPDPPTPLITTPSPRFLLTTETTGSTPLISNIKPSSAYAIPQPPLSNIGPFSRPGDAVNAVVLIIHLKCFCYFSSGVA